MNRLAMPGSSREGGPIHLVMGAGHDLERLVGMHLFVICANNSGSTFLQGALATCRATWNLPREGQETPGYVGPSSARPLQPGFPTTGLLWASDRFWMDRHADTDAYDWPRTRKAWYRQAYARDPRACVFVTKTPAHLLVVDDMARHFRNPRFLFMVRNPYAVCEGIFRQYGFLSHKFKALAEFRGTGRSLPEAAATHAVNCLARQRRNLERHLNPEAGEARRDDPIVRPGRGVFFSYETMCAHPQRTARAIEAAAPALNDLELRRRLPVKGRYREMLTDMNTRQITRLDERDVEALNRVFEAHREILDYFGYDLLPTGWRRSVAASSGRPAC